MIVVGQGIRFVPLPDPLVRVIVSPMLEYIMNMPFLLKVGISLLSIVLVNTFTRQLLAAMVTGVTILTIWCGHTPYSFVDILIAKTYTADFLLLMTIICQVMWLSAQMKETKIMDDLVQAVLSRTSGRTAAAILPAMIGLLPMPGGAWFSAPLVDKCDHKETLEPDIKTSVNYWFRHIWEAWWPLYPGVLLAIDLSKLEIWQFVAIQIPVTFVMITIGYLFFLIKFPDHMQDNGPIDSDKTGVLSILGLLMPVLVTVITYGAVKASWQLATNWIDEMPVLNKYLPMVLGLMISQVYLQIRRPIPVLKCVSLLITRRTIILVTVVFMVLMYGAVIDSPLPDGMKPVDCIGQELDGLGLNLVFMIIALPFIAGMSTGLAVGMVGVSFPVIISLAGENPDLGTITSVTALAYISGYAGMLLSPVHVCLLVTNQYFATSLLRSMRTLIFPIMLLLVTGLGLYLIYGSLL